jgi:hypothetical protein
MAWHSYFLSKTPFELVKKFLKILYRYIFYCLR